MNICFDYSHSSRIADTALHPQLMPSIPLITNISNIQSDPDLRKRARSVLKKLSSVNVAEVGGSIESHEYDDSFPNKSESVSTSESEEYLEPAKDKDKRATENTYSVQIMEFEVEGVDDTMFTSLPAEQPLIELIEDLEL